MSKIPAKIQWTESFLLDEMIEGISYANALCKQGWTFYVVDQTRGRCYYSKKQITIPMHAWRRKADGYLLYYISHEAAHAYAGHEAGHGPEFMQWLKRICPSELVHYELAYKPKAAMAAGIAPKDL